MAGVCPNHRQHPRFSTGRRTIPLRHPRRRFGLGRRTRAPYPASYSARSGHREIFRDAGIAPGHRVLELGSGVGDVAMLVARIVGRSGEVVAIERDARTISRALARAAEAGLHNINFVQTDIAECLSNSWYGFSLHISKLFNYLYVIICSRLWKKSSSQV